MAEQLLQTSQKIASTLFDELEQQGFVLTVSTEEGDKTPTKDFSNALVDGILRGLKENVSVKISGIITSSQPGTPAQYTLTGSLEII